MNRAVLALDIQPYFKVPEPMIASINKVAGQYPTAATVFVYDENIVPYQKLTGKEGPADKEPCLINTSHIFYKNGYQLPEELLNWFKEQNVDEVLVTGGQADAPVLAAGLSLFEGGFRPALMPTLCYGNEWYQHTVTMNIWERSLGPVYEHTADIGA